MASARTGLFGKLLGVVVLLLVLTLAGCGGGGGGGSGGTSGGPGKGVKVVVASKADADGELLAQMYALLLQNQDYTVTLRLGLGDNKAVDAAIKSAQIDIYPEFTGTALGNYGLPTTTDAQTAYQEVKTYYEQQFHITWLDAAYGLNDSYGICTSQANAQKYSLKTLDDLAKVSSQLVLAGQQDFTDPTTGVLPPVAKAYGLSFKNTVSIKEQLGFDAVKNGNADVNECYTTDPSIIADNFVLLTDTKNAFPNYNPAPVVRDALLNQSPAIATTLNPLAAKLTTASQTALIKDIKDGKNIKEVAQQYLQQQGLLPNS